MKAWNELSMAEKADVMKLAVEGGVYNLDAIRSGYNDYAKGGKIHIDPSKKGTFTAAASKHGKSVQAFASQVLAHPENYSPAMRKKANFARNASKWKHENGGNLYGGGGFASLITTPISPDVKEIRHRLYNGINPAGYQHIPKRIWEALNGKEANKSIYRDDQWATYLQIPEEERHHGVEKLKPARYKPSKGAPEGDVYRVVLNNEDTDNLIKNVQLLGLNIGENTVDRSLDKYFGDHTIGRGYDKKGEYVSYYDKYDLNPFAGGTTIKTGVRKVDKWLKDNTSNIDMSMGIGKPFEIYDRIYLDDYYKVPKEARGATFLPEVTVIGKKKKAFGGNLFVNGGEEEVTAFTPIRKPIIPTVNGDQQAVNWLANWYNNRREQMYNNLKDYDSTFWYDLADKINKRPVGRTAINHDYYKKLNNMARYKTATFDDLREDDWSTYETSAGEDLGITLPKTGKVYYDVQTIDDASKIQKRQEGFSPLGIHIHERTHTTGNTIGDFTGFNAQTRALEDIIRLKNKNDYDEYKDSMPEIYARMMEFRYNHNMNPKKKYSKREIQNMLEQEKEEFNSELQRYDLDSLTKALNEVAQTSESLNLNIFKPQIDLL